ncbi:MAG: ABC transporter permease, partial [Chloroflexi bacterium]|nr:ABC transporter permease [Chloroflexota bacterium]
MRRFILDRVLQAFIALWFVVTLVFFMVRLSGDPIALLAGEYSTPEFEAELRARYGLDQPVPVQYLIYMQRMAQGDFGTSIISSEPALNEVLDRWPATLEVAAMGILITLGLALPIGVYAAVHRGTVID